MGLENAGSQFQKMVKWVLRDAPSVESTGNTVDSSTLSRRVCDTHGFEGGANSSPSKEIVFVSYGGGVLWSYSERWYEETIHPQVVHSEGLAALSDYYSPTRISRFGYIFWSMSPVTSLEYVASFSASINGSRKGGK